VSAGNPDARQAPWVVLVTDPLSEEGLAVLTRTPGIESRVITGPDPAALGDVLAAADALIVRSGTRVTAELIAAAPRLKVVGRAGTGVDNIDVDAATRRGIVVMNTPGGNSVAACEHTFALLLAVLRNVPAAHRDLAGGVWNRKKYMGHELKGKTLGLIGFGRIGREVATRARAFGMQVMVADPFVSEALAREYECRLADRDAVLTGADIVSLHVPLTEETHHLIDAAALSRMKDGVVIVNCARGGLVDEAALLAGLESNKVGGAALDVFENEPPTGTALLNHPRVVATPHLGASTEEAQSSVAAEVAQQVVDYLTAGEVRNAVNMPSLSAEVYAQVKPYLDLAERLGSLAGQLADGPFRRLEVCFRGDAVGLPRAPVVAAALVGLLRTVPGGSVVNYVNARHTARELGVEVKETAREDAGDQAGLIEVALDSDGACTVAGTVTRAGRACLVRWEGLGLDAPASGHILALKNPDVPGVVGAIGTILGDAGVNIACISWGRDEGSRVALTLISLDSPVGDEALATIRKHPHVIWARPVRLP